jgi:hypothetical protein
MAACKGERMKMSARWAWIAITALGVTAGAQTSTGAGENGSAAAQAGQASGGVVQATTVSAELQKKIDSKDAKVGDEVVAKSTAEARLADGTKLPKGTRLVGHVTDVQAKSKENRDSHVTFAFDHAVLKDGREVPIMAMMRSIAMPVLAAPSGSDGMMGAGGGGSGPPRADAPGGGVGLAGNGPSNVRPTGLAAGTPAATVGGLNNATSGIDGSVNGATGASGALGTGASGALAAGPVMPVGNLAGVTFANVNAAAGAGNGGANGSAGASMATTLTGHGKNVSLDGGAQLTVAVAPRLAAASQ